MRRALAALVVTAAVVAWLVSWRTHPLERPRTRAVAAPVPKRLPPGTKVANGTAINTPFTTIQVQATLTRGRLHRRAGPSCSAATARTRACSTTAREPILAAPRAGGPQRDVDVVSGATYTSRSWRMSLASAIAKARD